MHFFEFKHLHMLFTSILISVSSVKEVADMLFLF